MLYHPAPCELQVLNRLRPNGSVRVQLRDRYTHRKCGDRQTLPNRRRKSGLAILQSRVAAGNILGEAPVLCCRKIIVVGDREVILPAILKELLRLRRRGKKTRSSLGIKFKNMRRSGFLHWIDTGSPSHWILFCSRRRAPPSSFLLPSQSR